ncbi:MAG TPA: hypothetical protein VGR37_01070 [Longimicrobiaceae bacterium]|nr:hypothetical protein [Longimicrobiaceae bacterium]
MNNENAPRFPVYVTQEGRTATLAVYVQVDPEPTVRPGDLEELIEEVARRIEKALEGIFRNLPAEFLVDAPIEINNDHVPFFPATFGDKVYEAQEDVFGAIEELRKGTPLQGMLFDCSGRAFGVHVYATFLRAAQHDRKVGEVWTLDHE